MNIQICILTGQPLANLIPILQFKPDRIAILVSDGMSRNLKGFQTTLKQAGWDETTVDYHEHMPDRGYEQIIAFVETVGRDIKDRYPQAKLTVNLTGGTKLMSMGTMMAMDTEDNALFYTDTQHQEIEFLDSARQGVEPMEAVLTLDLSLVAAGLTLRNKQDQDEKWLARAAQRKEATRFLANKAVELEGLIGQFNKTYSSDSQQNDSTIALTLSTSPKGRWLEALDTLEKTGVLALGENTSHWLPAMTDTARYLSGGWLEEYAWHCARDAGVPENCLGISVEFTDDSNRKADIRNEGDVMLVANNRLLLIECKTGNLSRDGKDQDTINKLSTLAEKTGGLMAEGLLVSSQPLERETKEKRKVNSRARAHAMDLRTLESDQLKNLRTEIQHWIEHGRWPKS